MVFKLKYRPQKPKDGESRVITRFAWLPVLIGGNVLWLGNYNVMQSYQISVYRVHVLDDNNEPARDEKGNPIIKAVPVGNWVNISKRIG